MPKTILITGATDGIGLETARVLVGLGHRVLLHGRNTEKLETVVSALSATTSRDLIESYVADLSSLDNVQALADAVSEKHSQLDVLINNAGVYMAPQTVTSDGLDVRFVVNTIAPYLLTTRLFALFDEGGRIINLSSAAQSTVNPDAFMGKYHLADGEAYAQSKLALTMWSLHLANLRKNKGPALIAVNPGSFLGSKMVKEAYDTTGKDLGIGADILTQAAISEVFASASGKYFDNDSGQFTSPHPDALDSKKAAEIINMIENLLVRGSKI